MTASWVSRLHSGGWVNVLMPAHALLALVAALGVGLAGGAEFAKWNKSARVAAYLLALAQFVVLIYNPARCVPTAGDLQEGRRLVRTVASLPGSVYVPCYGYLPARAGKRTFAHWQAVQDVRRGDPGRGGAMLERELTKAYARREFSIVVSPRDVREQPYVWLFYRLRSIPSADPEVYYPVPAGSIGCDFVCLSREEGPTLAGPGGISSGRRLGPRLPSWIEH